MDDSATVDPTERETLRSHLEQFADEKRVTEAADGSLVAEFNQSARFSVNPTGHVTGGMALHTFEGPADRIRFDHDSGEIHVTAEKGAVDYTFRRP